MAAFVEAMTFSITTPTVLLKALAFFLDGNVNFEDYTYFADTWLWQTGWL